MDQQTIPPRLSRSTTQKLERYSDRSRPPAPWVHVVTGVSLGAVIVLLGVLPAVWGAALVVLIAAVDRVYHRWLLHHHGVPKLRDLPAAVRRPERALTLVAMVAVGVPLLVPQLVPAFSRTSGATIAGIAVAILLAIGGPIVDRRARSTAGELLEHQPPNANDHLDAHLREGAEGSHR